MDLEIFGLWIYLDGFVYIYMDLDFFFIFGWICIYLYGLIYIFLNLDGFVYRWIYLDRFGYI